MSEHACALPDVETWDEVDDDWKCPDCGQDWFITTKDYCHSCYRSDGLTWEKFGTGDGTFPEIRVKRGGVRAGEK